MRGSNLESLNIDDGVIVTAETLEEVIKWHPEIEYVVLFWSWHSEYYTSNAGPFEAYISENRIDGEYSFHGDREDALKFADDYNCWDGEDLVILNGNILYGYREETDYQTSWTDGSDWINGVCGGIDPSWIERIRVYYDYVTNTEYVIEPRPIPITDRA